MQKSCSQESKKDHVEKGWPKPPSVDGIKIYDNDRPGQKHNCCLPTAESYSGRQQ